jgi:fructose-1,6-bisphosphatase/inositol monophosphatase family enzyme
VGSYARPPLGGPVKAFLHDLADAVHAAVRAFTGDLGEIVGMGADGTPTQRIDGPGEWTLILDPIDGTHNAVRGLPAFSVSVAAVPRAPPGKTERLRDVTAGLVRDLVTGHTYYAEAGKGASLNGRPIRVRKPFAPNDTVFDVYLGEKAHPDAVGVANAARRVRNLGAASLDLCLVARGATDLYYVHSAEVGHELRPMDIAAGFLIIREAGGDVVRLDRSPLDMDIHPRARTNLIAYGDEQILERVP